tara:strand:+ start:126 stop:410 length:285 start_codon:yes stop_codon:yes gene_type:complete
MSWLQIANKGIDAEMQRKLIRQQQRQRKLDLVKSYGKWGFIISYIENYIDTFYPHIKIPIGLPDLHYLISLILDQIKNSTRCIKCGLLYTLFEQ